MPEGKKIRDSGKVGLIKKDTLDDLRDLHDAIQSLEISPAGLGELTINGKKAILSLAGIKRLIDQKNRHPFEGYLDSSDDGEPVLKIAYGSLQTSDIDPQSGIDLDGIDDDIPTSEIGSEDFYCWIEVDVSGAFVDGSDPTAIIDYGAKWGSDGKDFWPSAIEYNTDDGKFDDDGEDVHQIKFYVPLFFVTSDDDIGEKRGKKIADDKWLVQLCRSNLSMGVTCNGEQYVSDAPAGLFPPGA